MPIYKDWHPLEQKSVAKVIPKDAPTYYLVLTFKTEYVPLAQRFFDFTQELSNARYRKMALELFGFLFARVSVYRNEQKLTNVKVGNTKFPRVVGAISLFENNDGVPLGVIITATAIEGASQGNEDALLDDKEDNEHKAEIIAKRRRARNPCKMLHHLFTPVRHIHNSISL